MSIINEDVIRSILTSTQDISTIHVLNWHVEDITDKNCNNYLNTIARLRILYRSQSKDSPQEKSFFVKVPINAPFHDILKNAGIYSNEVEMYTKVLPQMYSYTSEFEYFTARQYYFDDGMSLVLEDLSQSGYKCAARVEKIDMEQSIYALRCLAKFHALSVKLEDTVGLSDLVKSNAFFRTENSEVPTAAALMAEQMPMFIDSIPQHLADQYPDFVAYFKNLSVEMVVNSLNSSPPGKFNVLNHGDFNINNIMFRNDEFGTVRKVKLVDFQLTTWGSPACDLMYFAITSMKFEDYLEYFPLLLKIYVRTLNKVLRKLGCSIYNTRSLLNDIDTIHPYTLFILSCLLPYLICDPNEPIDLKEACRITKSDLTCTAKAYGQKFYRENSAKWFEHFAKNGTWRKNEETSLKETSTDKEPTHKIGK